MLRVSRSIAKLYNCNVTIIYARYCTMFNRNSAGVPIWEHSKKPSREKNLRR